MFSRLTRILLLCLALCAVVPGAFACAAHMTGSGDCCPPDHPGSCRTDQVTSAVANAAVCCVPPAATSVVTVANEQVKRDFTSPPVIADSVPQFLVRVHHVPPSLSQTPIPCFDRSQIYLQTGRLRL
jgi:hypothetical protein